ncbi:DsbA family protein [Brooklawnia sp.]|uniref:DsbA family protein n=1 Tax=Brooklawnia sp. TaxID=2699740 RepID=UPI00311FD94C
MSKKTNSSAPKPSSGSPTSRRETLRTQQALEARNNRVRGWVMFGTLGVALVLIVGLVTWGITQATKPAPTAPKAVVGDYSLAIGQADAPVTIAIYQDFMCPYCGQFERTNRDDIETLVADGTAKVELHLMNFLDPQSQGTNYSTRAASALIAVASAQPEHALAFNAALYDNQPAEGSTGLDDSQLADLAREAGVSEAVYSTFPEIANADRVDRSNQAALDAGITSTPTIKINGTDFASSQIFTPGALKSAVETAAGA